MAVSALDVLDGVRVTETLEEAIEDCHLVLGTSARLRNMPVQLFEPQIAAEKIALASETQEVALVFGREMSGLTNEELHLCHYHIHIPVNPEYTSLNLAAAVMVICYEVRKAMLLSAALIPEPLTVKTWDQAPATAADLDRYLEHLEKVLIELHFLDPDNPRQLMRRMRRLYQRIQPDQMEINILRGILTATEYVIDRQKPNT